MVETTGYTIQSAGLHGENMNHPNILKHCGNLHLSRSAHFIVVAVVVVVVAVIIAIAVIVAMAVTVVVALSLQQIP